MSQHSTKQCILDATTCITTVRSNNNNYDNHNYHNYNQGSLFWGQSDSILWKFALGKISWFEMNSNSYDCT